MTPNRPWPTWTWLRGRPLPTGWFQPADRDDLAAFLPDLDPAVPVFPIGVGSNLIVRDGGIRGLVIRAGPRIQRHCDCGAIRRCVAGAAALDAHVARARG